MKRIFSFLTFVVFVNASFSQVIEKALFPYEVVHYKKDRYVPYQYVREADVMWSKIVYEYIDLKQKENQYLALPADKTVRNTNSLIDVIMQALEKGIVVAYEASVSNIGGDIFSKPISLSEARENMGATVEEVVEEGLETEETYTVYNDYTSSEVVAYLIKEVWFFDKQRSVLDVRIMGICPIRVYEDNESGKMKRKLVFWIKYPEIRSYLAQKPVFWEQTDVMNITYDDVFQKRLFDGYFFLVSNPKNRAINEYKEGIDILVEAERLKQEMFNFEQDLWSY